MNPVYYRISVDVKDTLSNVSVSVKRGETNRRVVITPTDGGNIFDISNYARAELFGKKPDGLEMSQGCIIQNNAIVFDIPLEVTSVEGVHDCEIMLFGEHDTVLALPRFTVVVYPSISSEIETENSTEFASLTQLISETTSLISDVTSSLENGEFNGSEIIDITIEEID